MKNKTRKIRYRKHLYTLPKLKAKFGKRKAKKIWRKKNPISRKFDKRSIRTIKRGKRTLLIGCPRGKWMSKKKRCKVGTRLVEKRRKR